MNFLIERRNLTKCKLRMRNWTHNMFKRMLIKLILYQIDFIELILVKINLSVTCFFITKLEKWFFKF